LIDIDPQHKVVCVVACERETHIFISHISSQFYYELQTPPRDQPGARVRLTTALPLTWGVAAAVGRCSSGNGLGDLSFGGGLGRIFRLSLRLGLRVRLGEGLGGAQAGAQGGGQRAVAVGLVGLSPRRAHDEAVLPQEAKHSGWGIQTDGQPTIHT